MKITDSRLINHHLIGEKFQTPIDAVDHLTAVQAQDYFAASWSLGQRIQSATENSINQTFNDGFILRMHIMRPTWHFVLPEDITWIQQLTSSQVKKLMGHYNKKLELTDEVFRKANKIIANELKSNYLTRQELKIKLSESGIQTDVQRLAHIFMWAELDCLITSGPRIGKQFTYSLFSKRVKNSKILGREQGLAELALRYFQSHGPAQLKDFSWWSGLLIKDAEQGLDFARSKLISKIVDGKTYWFSPDIKSLKITSPKTFLLSIFDEYIISYKDREDVSEEGYIEQMISMGNALLSVIVIDGKVVGSWKRTLKTSSVLVELNLFREITEPEMNSVQKAVDEYGAFLRLTALKKFL